MPPECYRDIEACPGDEVTIDKEECTLAECVVYLVHDADSEQVEDSFVVPDGRSRARVRVVYAADEGGRCKVNFEPPSGERASACFEQAPGQATDTIEKSIVCGDGV